jgi:hypothetical protein
MKTLLVLALTVLGLVVRVRAATSDLWGVNGELWSPQSRLPDFSCAGYHCGEAEPPNVAPGVNVTTFGAKGDGVTDDTEAFLKALAEVKSGAIEVPAGRYRITQILEITNSGVVLRGAGRDETFLFFPKPLQGIKPLESATTEGRPTSEYSWAGGFVWFKGGFGGRTLATVTGEARRGDTTLRVSSAKGLRIGQRVEIEETDTPENSLARAIYSDDPGDMSHLGGSTRVSIVCRITGVSGDRVEFDRPLRFEVKPEWKPLVRSFDPTVSECGVENLCFEFPATPYGGHFTEQGYNAVAFSGVSDCWARHLVIRNADSGFFPGGRFCTIEGVVFESARAPDAALHCTGHHGIYLSGDDNLYTGFDYRTRFVHDITVSLCAGNVIADGRGLDLCFDHHKRAPYGNLFVNIDAGAGTRLWRCGGGAGLGKNCASGGTFWNIRAARPLEYPPAAFGPWSMNLVALRTDQPSVKDAAGKWFEAIAPEEIAPQDIHAAELARRLGR